MGEQRREWVGRGVSAATRAVDRVDPRLQNVAHRILLWMLAVARVVVHTWLRIWVEVVVRGGHVGDEVAFWALPVLQSVGRDGRRVIGSCGQQWERAVARVEHVVGAKWSRG